MPCPDPGALPSTSVLDGVAWLGHESKHGRGKVQGHATSYSCLGRRAHSEATCAEVSQHNGRAESREKSPGHASLGQSLREPEASGKQSRRAALPGLPPLQPVPIASPGKGCFRCFSTGRHRGWVGRSAPLPWVEISPCQQRGTGRALLHFLQTYCGFQKVKTISAAELGPPLRLAQLCGEAPRAPLQPPPRGCPAASVPGASAMLPSHLLRASGCRAQPIPTCSYCPGTSSTLAAGCSSPQLPAVPRTPMAGTRLWPWGRCGAEGTWVMQCPVPPVPPAQPEPPVPLGASTKWDGLSLIIPEVKVQAASVYRLLLPRPREGRGQGASSGAVATREAAIGRRALAWAGGH